MAEKLLFADEVAELTRLSVNTLAWFRHEGTGPKWAKFGRRCVYKESDVLAWMDAQFAANEGGAA